MFLTLNLSLLLYWIFSWFNSTSSVGYFIIVTLTLTLSVMYKSHYYKQRHVNPIFIVTSILFLWLGVPLYENDYFRYFFEGELFWQGQNVYTHPPEYYYLGLESVYRQNIAYADIPSLYGPLAHLLHGFFVNVSGNIGALIYLQTFYFLLVIYIGNKYKNDSRLLICLPFLCKEFINSVHIDFLATISFAVGIYLFHQRRSWHGCVLILSSLLFKPTGFVAIPMLLMYLFSRISKGVWFAFFLLTFFYALEVASWPAITIFATKWQWNAGIIKLLVLKGGQLNSWLGIFIPLLLSILFMWRHWRKQSWKNEQFNLELALIFYSQILFSATINSWYLLWPLSFFIMSRCYYAVYWISLSWPLCYGPWLDNDISLFISVIFHIGSFLVLMASFGEYLLNRDFLQTRFNLMFPLKRKIFSSHN